MRVAIFSDVHGNSIALDAVLADVERVGGVDAFWFIGDAASQGFDPVGSVQRITALPDLKAVRGNTDHHSTADTHLLDDDFVQWVTGDREAALRTYAIVSNFYWTRGAVTATGYFDWLAELPVEERVDLPDGTRVLLVHAAPGTDDGAGIHDGQGDAELGEILAAADADLVVVGHTHKPLDRTVNGVRVWNLGSVSNPATSDERAMWTLLDADESGYQLERQFAPYDVAEVLSRLVAVHQPAESHIRKSWALGR